MSLLNSRFDAEVLALALEDASRHHMSAGREEEEVPLVLTADALPGKI